MKAARAPRHDTSTVRLMVVRGGAVEHSSMESFADHLRAGDLVVVNDAATLPASLHGRHGDASLEIRLVACIGGQTWQAVTFGPGNWRTPTEARLPPPRLSRGDEIVFTPDFRATVVDKSELSERLLQIDFNVPRDRFWESLYRYGKPVQYSYLTEELKLWSIQNVYSGRPWAMEMPSAGYALNVSVMLELLRRGVKVVALTHAAGISSTGDAQVDHALPLPERFEVPPATMDAVAKTKAAGGRVIAIGTSVVRALESAGLGLIGTTNLKLGSGSKLRIVDGLLTGTHDASESHYQLLRAFLAEETLERVSQQLEEQAYLTHEFGDLCLVLPSRESPTSESSRLE